MMTTSIEQLVLNSINIIEMCYPESSSLTMRRGSYEDKFLKHIEENFIQYADEYVNQIVNMPYSVRFMFVHICAEMYANHSGKTSPIIAKSLRNFRDILRKMISMLHDKKTNLHGMYKRDDVKAFLLVKQLQ